MVAYSPGGLRNCLVNAEVTRGRQVVRDRFHAPHACVYMHGLRSSFLKRLRHSRFTQHFLNLYFAQIFVSFQLTVPRSHFQAVRITFPFFFLFGTVFIWMEATLTGRHIT